MRTLFFFCAMTVASPAAAFTIESPIGDGCHERITVHALASAPFAPDVPTLVADDTHRRLTGAMPFTVPPEALADPRVLALLIGVRSPDTAELSIYDLDGLASLHGSHGEQHAHCLRDMEDDGAAGDAAAIAACRAEILDELERALGPADTVDAGTESVTVSLAFVGRRTLELPRYEYRLGRALHALQDSFPHAFRDASGHHVVAVHNWIDWVSRHDFDAARDGQHHVSSRDECGADDEAMGRAVQAELASTALLAAVADPTGGRAGRLMRADAVLDDWLTVTPGCDATNDFCGAPDAVVVHACSVSPGTTSGLPAVLVCVLVLALLLGKRARWVALAGAILLLSSTAQAQDRGGGAWGATVSGAASFDKAALAVGLGGRYFANDAVRFGVDVELAPWIWDPPLQMKPGTFDAFASVQVDWARTSWLRVGTRFAAGISVLLFDLPGASAGDVGPYFAGTLIGVGIDLGHGLELRVDPEISVAMPHVVGLPLVYRQYRLTVTLVWRP